MKDTNMLMNGEFSIKDLSDEELQQELGSAKLYFDRLTEEKTYREDKANREKGAEVIGKCFISLNAAMIYQVTGFYDGKYRCSTISYSD